MVGPVGPVNRKSTNCHCAGPHDRNRHMREREWPSNRARTASLWRTRRKRGANRGAGSQAIPSSSTAGNGTAALANPARRFRQAIGDRKCVAAPHRRRHRIAPRPRMWCGRTRIAARLTPDAVHQGLIAEADPLPSPASRIWTPPASCWCSIRLPIRTMSARSCAPPRRSRRRRSSHRAAQSGSDRRAGQIRLRRA